MIDGDITNYLGMAGFGSCSISVGIVLYFSKFQVVEIEVY